MIDEILFFVILYMMLNAVSLIIFGIDKRRAVKERYRIRESTLLMSGFLGPFGAVAGMKIFRHKTRKAKFKSAYVFLVIHVVIICFLVRNVLVL